MKFSKGLFGKLGLALAGALVEGVGEVDAIAKKLPALKGKAKQDALVDLVTHALQMAEGVTDKDLLDDAEVALATRSVIDAVVHLDNIVEARRRMRVSSPTPRT